MRYSKERKCGSRRSRVIAFRDSSDTVVRTSDTGNSDCWATELCSDWNAAIIFVHSIDLHFLIVDSLAFLAALQSSRLVSTSSVVFAFSMEVMLSESNKDTLMSSDLVSDLTKTNWSRTSDRCVYQALSPGNDQSTINSAEQQLADSRRHLARSLKNGEMKIHALHSERKRKEELRRIQEEEMRQVCSLLYSSRGNVL